MFATFAIRDFHTEASSLMDAAALVAIMANPAEQVPTKNPSFSWIRSGKLRKALCPDVRDLVDATDSWWPFVSDVRDAFIHGEQEICVFGPAPLHGCLFQLYEGSKPLITDRALAANTGSNIADAVLYSAWVTSEMTFFLDRLGELVAGRFSHKPEYLPDPARRIGDPGPFHRSVDEIIARIA